jgi:hypothetical protein
LIARGLTNTQIDNTLGFLASLSGPVPRTGDQKLFLPKVDWNINDNNTLTVSYNRLRWNRRPAFRRRRPTRAPSTTSATTS